jgi:uncharacterized protein YggT (Ycf19 family)
MYPLLLLINTIFGFVEAILGIRFILKLFAASPEAPFIRWLYAISEPLLRPFLGAFPSPVLEQGVVLEFVTLFAIIIYALLRYFLIELIYYITYGTRRAHIVSGRRTQDVVK